MAKNFLVLLPNGEFAKFTEGSTISNIQVIAGFGKNREIDIVDYLVLEFGGKEELWQKVKGIGYLDYHGESYKSEVHWYSEPTAGDFEHKLKSQIGGNWFIEED